MNNALWQTVLGEIELSVSRASFVTWFKNTELISTENGEVVIGVPNIFAKQQLEVKFSDQLATTLHKNGVNVASIRFIISIVNKKTRSQEVSSAAAPLITTQMPRRNASATSNSGLDPKYTFESFIVGSSNELAYTACQAVSKHPGT